MAESMAKSGALLYKAEGNAAFQGGEYEKALQSYSDGIAALHAYTPAEDSIGGGAAAEPELLTVLFSNRAESLLRLARHEEALAAAEEALTITPCHKKSLSRKAKAAAAIQQRTATQSGTAGKLEGESAAPAAGAAGAAANPQNGTRSAALEARAGRVERLQQATQAPEPEPEPAAAPPSSVGPGPSAGAVATGRRPVCAIVVGMAGSGKTTLMQRLNAHLYQKATPGYVINLDPAVQHTPYEANIDIRDTVDFKQVMKEYKLGPNGGIMTALNLFATRFDKVMDFVEKRAKQGLKYFLVDTPGQIEIFTWSASGAIISETLATAFPTVIVYVMDTPRNQASATFMSNMMYACSILYKTRLPMVIAFNKVDVVPCDFAMNWMTDSDAFQETLQAEQSDSYMSSLTHSMAMVMDEFYSTLNAVGVSAVTGQGCDELFSAIDAAGEEFEKDYQPTLDARIAARAAERAEAATRQAAALRRDLSDGDSDAPPSKEVTGLQRVQTQRSQRYPDQHQTELGPQQVNGTDEDSSSSSDSDVAECPSDYGTLLDMMKQRANHSGVGFE